jgi:tRNA pseudouridine-54 N-methylase
MPTIELYDVLLALCVIGLVVHAWLLSHKVNKLRSDINVDLTTLCKDVDDLEIQVENNATRMVYLENELEPVTKPAIQRTVVF